MEQLRKLCSEGSFLAFLLPTVTSVTVDGNDLEFQVGVVPEMLNCLSGIHGGIMGDLIYLATKALVLTKTDQAETVKIVTNCLSNTITARSLTVQASVTRLGRSMAFTEATIIRENGKFLCRGSHIMSVAKKDDINKLRTDPQKRGDVHEASSVSRIYPLEQSDVKLTGRSLAVCDYLNFTSGGPRNGRLEANFEISDRLLDPVSRTLHPSFFGVLADYLTAAIHAEVHPHERTASIQIDLVMLQSCRFVAGELIHIQSEMLSCQNGIAHNETRFTTNDDPQTRLIAIGYHTQFISKNEAFLEKSNL